MAVSVSLVTVTVSGVFTILPNRTIAIAKATINPSSLPVPVYTETPPPISSSTSGPLVVQPSNRQSELDKTLLIALLCGIVGPIVLCLTALIMLRYFTLRLAKLHGIPFSPFKTWFVMPTFPSASAGAQSASTISTTGKSKQPKVTATETVTEFFQPKPAEKKPVMRQKSAAPSAAARRPLWAPGGQDTITAYGSSSGPSDDVMPFESRHDLNRAVETGAISAPPVTVLEEVNDQGQIIFKCINHHCVVPPETWICPVSNEWLSEELRVRQ